MFKNKHDRNLPCRNLQGKFILWEFALGRRVEMGAPAVRIAQLTVCYFLGTCQLGASARGAEARAQGGTWLDPGPPSEASLPSRSSHSQKRELNAASDCFS